MINIDNFKKFMSNSFVISFLTKKTSKKEVVNKIPKPLPVICGYCDNGKDCIYCIAEQ